MPENNVPENNLPGNNTQKNTINTTSNKAIIYAGLQNYSFAMLSGGILIGFIAYIKYKQYKDI